ncbi:hypothetical protein K0810_00995 [Erysipelothrix rhusiopathiae]|uniref:hypothetical protein n=1 Tax=Erysipelothrix rhusiopathiae TaxID=1648 RepID=UPI000210B56B|nr:hypothetical protein [Erysipelothrix rhusiopathiae]AGN24506.1 hypothetical protein K210_04515 [Erysipelothrix rhusiopathiae SY1027]AMS10754.1 hypothetical protein A2I91_02960 [Erysipelothrix rhusiopathiae]AOO66974.1 hypothetical protein BC346_01145 [Erysipelothrix rhusiopathiae]AWU41880.1 hypothetical protein DM789_06520 [Erysipelothrix rhusiopathiae]MDE8282880.1 hypothetical protein [Erysipelothrix rhusiopathiae]
MNNSTKQTLSFVLIFLGLAIAIFGGSTLGSFIITDIIIHKMLNVQGNLGTLDLVVRITLIVVGFFISGIGAILFRKLNKNK